MSIYVLGIESTAHTLGMAVVNEKLNILSDIREVYIPSRSLGIDPHDAAEYLSKKAREVFKETLNKASVNIEDIDAIAYSMGPGLGPCLRIGATIARLLSYKYNKPLYPVHHAIGHIELVRLYYDLNNPLVILVSGGHTLISSFTNNRWRVYGETLDITLGNLLDMFAREIGLGFPGGPKVEELASKGSKYIELPYTIKGTNLQFSGLLTNVISLYKKNMYTLEDLALSLQETAFSMLVEASERALTQLNNDSIAVTGGVASNDRLYAMLVEMGEEHGLKVYRLPKRLNSDNGVQIAAVGLKMYLSNVEPIDVENAIIKQRWRLDEVEVTWR